MKISRRDIFALATAVTAAAAIHPAYLEIALASDRPPENHVIVIEKFRFVSDIRPILPGDTVTWINHDIVPHTATAVDESWDTGEIAAGQQKTLQINPGISTGYFCRFHPMMRATLDVDQ